MASRFFDGKSKVPGEDELSNYVSAGYFMTKPVVRPPYVSWVLPREIISLSECICSFLPGAWSVEWVVLSRDDREQAAKELGVDLPRVIRWATDQFEKQCGWIPGDVRGCYPVCRAHIQSRGGCGAGLMVAVARSPISMRSEVTANVE